MTGGLGKRSDVVENHVKVCIAPKHLWNSQMSIKWRVGKVTERVKTAKLEHFTTDSERNIINR